MINLKSNVKRIKRQILTMGRTFKNSICYAFYYHASMDSKLVFIESRNGRDFAGNMLRILQEILKQFDNEYTIVIAVRKDHLALVQKILQYQKLSHIKICFYESITYYWYLYRAKYLFNDTTFPDRFIKRDDQIYVNTWHGTPLKYMGKDSHSDRGKMDNVQRNLLMSDYLVAPNSFFQNIMLSAYCLEHLFQGRVLLEGYPRNTIFYDSHARNEVREHYGLNGKTTYAYMPTFRECSGKRMDDVQLAQLKQYFGELDAAMTDKEILYVKLHYFVQKGIDFNAYKHILPYPQEIETYEFLNAVDGLISDYSSVLFDYANSGRKIIRFTYDEAEYYEKRGFYQLPVEFPYPKVTTSAELLREMRQPISYDDSALRKIICTHENPYATHNIILHCMCGQVVCKEYKTDYNTKENIVFYAGNLSLNGITASLHNLLSTVPKEKRRFFISWSRKIMQKADSNFDNLPNCDGIIGFSGVPHMTVIEMFACFFFYKLNRESKWVSYYMNRLFIRENKKCFSCANFSKYIQFVGYERVAIGLFQRAFGKRIIYVHNDMVSEIKQKGNQHFSTLRSAYKNYDKVAVVSRQLIKPTVQISGSDDRIVLAENFYNDSKVRQKANQTLSFQRETTSSHSISELGDFFKNHNQTFITIGRFSSEKGHLELIEAFERVHQEHPKIGLIIIGGYGVLHKKTVDRAKAGSASKDIVIIKSLANPMPILKQCDLFILSSKYEGLGLVLLEAISLNVPLFSTRVTGPELFLSSHGGYMVDCTVEGLIEGMDAYLAGKIKPLSVDWDTYNRKCLEQFEKLLA